jgi:hypothetical protein
MQVSDELVNHMLRNLPQDQQDVMAGILRDEYAYEVTCNSQDQYREVEEFVFDEDGESVYYKSGEKKGQQKTKKVKKLVQEGVKGRVIAYITTDNKVVPVAVDTGTMFLRSSRRRTDGEWGFESWCGTDSRLAAHEQGILGADQPSKDDLYRMAAKLEQNPPKYVTINGEREVDGFIIREVRK